jgi:transcriptional antiterminator RfaH
MEDVEVFNPCIKFARPTRNGPMWIVESLFPNYLFARFDWTCSLPKVHYAPGISGVVHFGTQWPCIPDETIAELRASLGPNELHLIPSAHAVLNRASVSTPPYSQRLPAR